MGQLSHQRDVLGVDWWLPPSSPAAEWESPEFHVAVVPDGICGSAQKPASPPNRGGISSQRGVTVWAKPHSLHHVSLRDSHVEMTVGYTSLNIQGLVA